MLFPILAAIFLGLALFAYRLKQDADRRAKEAHHQASLLRRERKVVIDFLHEIGEAFQGDLDHAHIFSAVLKSVVEVTHARSGIVYLKTKDGAALEAQEVLGLFPPSFPLPDEVVKKLASKEDYLKTILKNERLKLIPGNPLAEVCQSGQPLVLNKAIDDPRFPKFHDPDLQLVSLLVVPLVYRNEHLGVLALANHSDPDGFTEADVEMAKSVAEQASFSIFNAEALAQLTEKKQIDRDLETAREIQNILLPKKLPNLQGYSLAAANQPAAQVSGDYYDFIEIDDDHIGIVIGDVSGKGVPASLIMAMGRTLVRTQAIGQHSPSEVLRRVNRLLHPDIRPDMFITMAYMIVNTRTHQLTSAKAGHDAPLVFHKASGVLEPLQSPGLALGIDSGDVFDMILADCTVTLEPGDLVVAYTDGISEAFDRSGEEFGREQIRATILENAGESPEKIVQNLLKRVARFQADTGQSDDMTLVALKRL
jgi:sigma-B regulation protein RsbU (phosphoserine phosphatase)